MDQLPVFDIHEVTWDLATNEGEKLYEIAHQMPIVAISNVTSQLQMQTTTATIIQINPDIKEIRILKNWTYYCFKGKVDKVDNKSSLCTAIDTISVNQSIRDPEALVSNGQNFKLGFFSPGNGNNSYRYVGIMYNLPLMTVIWVANREKPLTDSSGIVEISSDGNIVISNGENEIVWSSNISSPEANSSAQLLDTGNLVLYNSNGGIIWESFQHASDSVIENMKILTSLSTNERNIPTSWRSSNDPGLGRFSVTIEPLEIPQCFVLKDGYPYWRSGPWNGQVFNGVPGMMSFYKRGLHVFE
ncbi:hypothetical protein BUALT_Bualt07G0064900 [Buddleja alternifolia]|uniref:Bulb-type lectin domain-containing protein n=1 Tax=Buddleja alternifolia TaxID=168488 RepID=A0AAV6XJA9_9LAMI|nr:hypothetical protein BUALT_Bualt07G0064900 [Buddleja alternifolia]